MTGSWKYPTMSLQLSNLTLLSRN